MTLRSDDFLRLSTIDTKSNATSFAVKLNSLLCLRSAKATTSDGDPDTDANDKSVATAEAPAKIVSFADLSAFDDEVKLFGTGDLSAFDDEVKLFGTGSAADWPATTTVVHVVFDNNSTRAEDARACVEALDRALRAAAAPAKTVTEVLLNAKSGASNGDTVLDIIARRTTLSAEWFKLFFEFVGNDRSAVTRMEKSRPPPIAALCAVSSNAVLAKQFLLTTVAEREIVTKAFTDSRVTSCLYGCVAGDNPNVPMLELLVECDPQLAQLDEPVPTDEDKGPPRFVTLLHDACSNSRRVSPEVLDYLCKLQPAWVSTQSNWDSTPLMHLCDSHPDIDSELIVTLCKNGGATEEIMCRANRGTNWAPLEALVRTLILTNRRMQDPPYRPQVQHMNELGYISPPSKFIKVPDFDEKRALQYRQDLERYNMQKKAFDADMAQRRTKRPPFRDDCVAALLENCDDKQRNCTLLQLSENKDTILHFAVRENLPTLITVVLANNPQAHKLLKRANGANELPDALARKLGTSACLAALSGMDADDLRSGDSKELFAKAIRSGNDVVVELLLQQNPDYLSVDLEQGRGNAMNWSISCNRRFIVELLLRTADTKALELIAKSALSAWPNCLQQAVVLAEETIVTVMAKLADLTSLITDELLRLSCRDAQIMAILIREVVQEHHKTVVALREKQEIDRGAGTPEQLPTIASAFGFVQKQWDLSGLKLSDIRFPPDVRYLGVERIDLSNNALLVFPVSVLHFRKLSNVNLSHNLIGDISARNIIAALRVATEKRELDLSLRHNRLTFIPPELYTLKNVRADTSRNPLTTSLFLPAWFFGLNYDRLVLAAIDLFFLFTGAIIVMVGRLFADQPNVGVVVFFALAFYFSMLFASSWALGLSKIPWSDSRYSPIACCNPGLAAAERENQGVEQFELVDDDDGEDGSDDEAADESDESGGDQFEGLTSVQLDGARDKAMDMAAEHLKLLSQRDDVKSAFGSAANILALIALVLELPTLLSLSFSVDIWPQQIVDTFVFFRLNIRAIQNALGNPSLDIVLYHITFWVSVLLVLVQRLMLELSRYQRVSSFAATILQSSLSLTLLPVFTNLAKVFDCTYGGGLPSLDELDQTHVQCWVETQHIVMACVSLVCMAIYYPVAVLTIPIWQNRSDGLSIKFPSYFLILSAQIKLVLSLLVTFFTADTFLYLGLNLAATVVLLLLMVFLRSPFLELTSPSYRVMWGVRMGRIGSYVVTVIGAVAALITARFDNDAFSVGCFFTMMGINLLVGIICGFIVKRGPRNGPPASDVELAGNTKRNEDANNDNDVELYSRASNGDRKRNKPENAMCQQCGVRPVQAIVRKDDIKQELCRLCIKKAAYALKATPSEYAIVNDGLRERNTFYTLRGAAD